MIVWGLDRFIGFVSLVAVNFRYLDPWSSQDSKKELDAVVEVLSPHYVRVSLHRSKHFHWRPGQNVYLSFPSISRFPFESHPFTISTINEDSKSDNSTLEFILRAQRGFTQKLHKEASPDTTYSVFLKGPYGSPPLLIGYQTVILIAGLSLLFMCLALLIVYVIGGSGVVFTLSLFLDILRLILSFTFLIQFILIFTYSRAKSGKNTCQKVLFIWAIRDTGSVYSSVISVSPLTTHTPLEHIHWIANNLAPALDNIPASISVAVKLYITGAGAASQGLDESLKESSSEVMHISDSQLYSTILQSLFVQVSQGRPNLKQLISNEIGEATGRMSINGLYFIFTNCVLSIKKIVC